MSKVLAIANAAGLELQKRGRRLFARCVFHDENTPSMTVNPEIDAVHCFGCGRSAGYVEFARHLGVDMNAALGERSMADLPLVPAPRAPKAARSIAVDTSELPNLCQDRPTMEYLAGRKWGRAFSGGMIVFPTRRAPVMKTRKGQLMPLFALGYRFGVLLRGVDAVPTGYQLRKLTGSDDGRRFYTAGGGTFGDRSRVPAAGCVYVAEGLGDYLTLAQAYDRPGRVVLGIPGASVAADLLAECAFTPGTEVVTCFDRDEAGDKATRAVHAAVTAAGCIALRGVPAEGKDVSEAYMARGEKFLEVAA